MRSLARPKGKSAHINLELEEELKAADQLYDAARLVPLNAGFDATRRQRWIVTKDLHPTGSASYFSHDLCSWDSSPFDHGGPSEDFLVADNLYFRRSLHWASSKLYTSSARDSYSLGDVIENIHLRRHDALSLSKCLG